ncbi:uncharacterized protein [Ptychodera flava]|uniref:uncharacterized protein n=1 Tax=Ptychodera flava TaxID=63121 RepID=UPI003969F7A2
MAINIFRAQLLKFVVVLLVYSLVNFVIVFNMVNKNGGEKNGLTRESFIHQRAVLTTIGSQGSTVKSGDEGKQLTPKDMTEILLENPKFFIIKQNWACSSITFNELHVLIIVVSLPQSGEKRAAIRLSWAKGIEKRGIRVLFLIGKSENSDSQKRIEEENAKHHDIIQVDLREETSIASSTQKLIVLMHWTRHNCRNAKYVLKVDEQTLVVPANVLEFLEKAPRTGFAGGWPFINMKPVRNINSPWFISEAMWPHSKYPPYLGGSTFLLSIDVLLRASLFCRKLVSFPFENVYLGSILEKLRLNLTQVNNFDIQGSYRKICQVRSSLLSTKFETKQMIKYWDALQTDLQTVCDNKDPYLDKLRFQQQNDGLNGSRIINDFSYQFSVNPRNLCFPDFPDKQDWKEVFLLIITPSRAVNSKQRDMIRNTRGSRKFTIGKKIVQLFLIGKTFDTQLDADVLQESRTHEDVIVVDIRDSYENMTLKTVMMLKWTSLYCTNAKYILKADDDVFVNLHDLVVTLIDQPISRFVLAYVHKKTWPLRDRKHKWYVSEDEWPLNEPYPPYPNGPAYVMSYDVATKIYSSSYTTELFRFEDVYIGINLRHIGIVPTHSDRFDNFGKLRTICELKGSLSSHYVHEDMMYKLWRQTEEWGKFVHCKTNDIASSYQNIDKVIVDNGRVIIPGNVSNSTRLNTFIINHAQKCSPGKSQPFLVVCVFSRPGNVQLRTAIRDTWGKPDQEISGVRVVTVFFTGVYEDNVEMQEAILEEDAKFGDIIQNNFIDSYENQVIKTVTILHWTSTYCAGAAYLIKVDDDVLLNIRSLIEFLEYSPRKALYFGDLKLNAKPERGETSKWYTPPEAWERGEYPPYASKSYVLSLDVADAASQIALATHVFKWEDVYVGIMAERLGIQPLPHIHFDITGAYRSQCTLQSAIMSSQFSAEMLRKYWKILRNSTTAVGKCNGLFAEKVKPYVRDHAWTSQQLCSSNSADIYPIFLVVLVNTSPDQLENRNVARLTWARINRVLGERVEVKFVIGTSSNERVQNVIEKEANHYGDVIISKLLEADANSTLKRLNVFQWVRDFCSSAKFVMVVPADSFVNIRNVISHIRHAPLSNHIACFVQRNVKPIRQKGSPWYISVDDWPFDYFPPHCNEKTASIMSMDILQEVLYHSQNKKTIKFPEIQIGTILHKYLKNTQLSHNTAFYVKGMARYLQDGGNNDICGLDSIMATNGFTGQIMQYVIEQVINDNLEKCQDQRRKELADKYLQKFNNREKFNDIINELQAKLNNQTIINIHEYSTVIDHPERCRRHWNGVFLFIMVRSNPEEREYRNAIRSTWSKETAVEGVRVDYIFLLGRPEDAQLQRKIWLEDEENEDIVQEDFLDVFRNQTLKIVMALKWASQNCADVKYIFMTKSNTFIHVSNMMLYLKSSFTLENDLVVGHILKNTRPVRNPDSSYFVPVEIYPEERYPPYPEGKGYLMSGDVMHKAYVMSQYTASFLWEDVYFGMLLQKLSIIPRFHSDFISDSLNKVPDVCYMRNAFIWNVVAPEAMGASYYKLQNSQNISCFEKDRIKPDLYEFKVSSDHLCKEPSDNIYILLAVMTSPTNFGRRRAIRETWGMHYENITDFYVKTVFMVGIPRDEETQFMLKEENDYYHDIVQSTFIDSYQNLTLKTVMMLKWVANYCPNSKFVIKVDDDVFVNIENVISLLNGAQSTEYSLGFILYNSWPIRDPKHKNYTPRRLWPDRSFPPYYSGPCYFLSTDVVKTLYKASFSARWFTNEDVFIGALMQSIGLSLQGDPRFDISGDARDVCRLRSVLATHKVMARDMYKFWYWLNSQENVECNDANLPDRHFYLYYQNQTSWQNQEYAFPIANRKFCHKSLTSLIDNARKSVLIVVGSLPENVEARNAIRDTWGRLHENYHAVMITLFFIGTTTNHTDTVQALVEKESEFRGDIVQTNVSDFLYSATFKTIAIFTWLAKFCDDVNYVIKTDDGTFLNSPMILHYFETSKPPTTDLIAGSVIHSSRPIRDVQSQYYTPEEVWPNEKFPVYVETPTYLLSMDVVKRVDSVARTTQPVFWEDVFLGVLLQKLSIKPSELRGFDFKGEKRINCEYGHSLATAFFTPNQMRSFWRELRYVDIVCGDQNN